MFLYLSGYITQGAASSGGLVSEVNINNVSHLFLVFICFCICLDIFHSGGGLVSE